MSLDDMLMADAAAIFADSANAFEVESVTYVSAGGTFTPSVQVFRNAPTEDSMGRILLKTKIFMPRTDTGVGTVTAGKDVVTIAVSRGGTTVDHRVTSIESDDGGGWMLVLN